MGEAGTGSTGAGSAGEGGGDGVRVEGVEGAVDSGDGFSSMCSWYSVQSRVHILSKSTQDGASHVNASGY